MAWSPASGRREIEQALRRIGGTADGAVDLAEAALLLAALDRPRVALERYRHHLGELARDAAAEAEQGPADLGQRVQVLRRVLVERHGYRGDELTYDDLQNANLMRVIDRRKGLPVALGILYMATARAQGWSICGLGFPSHFLLRLELGAERLIIDPFRDGEVCDTAALRALLKRIAGGAAELGPAHYAPVADRDILLRLQNNIKLRLLQQDRTAEAIEVLESMLMIAPDRAGLWYEAGRLHGTAGNLRAASLALGQALELGRDERERAAAAQLLQEIKTRLN